MPASWGRSVCPTRPRLSRRWRRPPASPRLRASARRWSPGSSPSARTTRRRTTHSSVPPPTPPAKDDPPDRPPADPAPRAEAAFSAAQIVRFKGWELPRVQEAAATFSLPPLDDWQRKILTTAVKLVGYPYIWAGTSDRTQL